MKKLRVLAICLFSIFTIYSFQAQAVQCGSEDGSQLIDLKSVRECEGVSDGHTRDIFDYLLFFNKIALFVSFSLLIFGAYKLSTKKEMEKKEQIIASLFVYSPLLPIFFFIVVKLIQNLM